MSRDPGLSAGEVGARREVVSRRDVVRGAAATFALAFGPGCGTPADSGAADASCTAASQGADGLYCLVDALLVRVVGAGSLLEGQAVLLNVDDNTGVIVARDAGGLHALSAICTHACCLVSLCADADCAVISGSPDACTTGDIAASNADGASILCPCHGSTFRLTDGGVVLGPATRALPAYAVSVDGDDVLVDTGTQVDPSVRV